METNSVVGLVSPSNENDLVSRSYDADNYIKELKDVDNYIKELKDVLKYGLKDIAGELKNQCHDGNNVIESILDRILTTLDNQFRFERNEEVTNLISNLEENTKQILVCLEDLKKKFKEIN